MKYLPKIIRNYAFSFFFYR